MSQKANDSSTFPCFNRELSWLAFNQRVLEQAKSTEYPLLERMKFLAFFSSNLDEFFEIRVSGLMQQVKSGVIEMGPDGLGPKEQIQKIRAIVNRLIIEQVDCWTTQIVPSLEEKNVLFCNYAELTRNEQQWLTKYFEEQIFPVLTPLAIDPAHPFPHLTNKALYILASIDDPKTRIIESMMAIIPVPRILPRIVRIGVARRGNVDVYIFLSDIIHHYIKRLFPGYQVRSAVPFRITRNSDLYIDEEEVKNLLRKMEEELVNRQKGATVRLEIAKGADPVLLEELLKALGLQSDDAYIINGPINLMRLMGTYDLIDRPDLKFPPQIPFTPPELRAPANLFEQIKKKDILLHHPYESFQPFIDFLVQAAEDPQVFAIKQTLYRTSGDSPIVEALMEASRRGKQVSVLIEIKARFDEANNIQWARRLEDVGVHVVYGLVGLKTHCKTSMVVRREQGALRRYVHLGTGNYNQKTARLYTDLSFFTADPSITAEVAGLFNTLTGFSLSPVFEKLHVAPFNLHSKIKGYIQAEAQNAKEGKPARIIAQMNSLVDQGTIENLYKASQAGVKIDLIIRGICTLVPQLKGISENINVRSILGRYLEHSRILYFENSSGDQAHIFAGSSDWMPRNFFRRIESIFPIEAPLLRQRLILILETDLKDTRNARVLHSNGSYYKVRGSSNKAVQLSAQEFFYQEFCDKRRKLETGQVDDAIAQLHESTQNKMDSKSEPDE
ncbi:MAG: polyphosphate kinase [Lentimonas sp.]|jgi:polyphosphate kinase